MLLTALTLLHAFILHTWNMPYPDLNPSLQVAFIGSFLSCTPSSPLSLFFTSPQCCVLHNQAGFPANQNPLSLLWVSFLYLNFLVTPLHRHKSFDGCGHWPIIIDTTMAGSGIDQSELTSATHKGRCSVSALLSSRQNLLGLQDPRLILSVTWINPGCLGFTLLSLPLSHTHI